MKTLLEMVKNDRNAREFLHECYMEDPDHVGTGFSRWLVENEGVLPVYIECMTRIDGCSGSMLESFVLARMEDGYGKVGGVGEKKYIPEATKLYFNKDDEEKLNMDPGYQGVLETVEKVISKIVNSSINMEPIDIGNRAVFNNLEDLIAKVDGHTLDAQNVSLASRMLNDMNDQAKNLIVDLFETEPKQAARFFARPLFGYIRKYAKNESPGYHKSLKEIIHDGIKGLVVEPDIKAFAKYAFFNSIGAKTAKKQEQSTNGIAELTNILTDTLSKYKETKEIVKELVNAYNTSDEMVKKILEEKNVLENYPGIGDIVNHVFTYIDNNPSADDQTTERVINSAISAAYRKNIIDAISDSKILREDEKNIATEYIKYKMIRVNSFIELIKWFEESPTGLAIGLLSNKKNKIKYNTEEDDITFERIGKTGQQKNDTMKEDLLGKIIFDLNNIKQRLAVLKSDDGFIESLIKEFENSANKHQPINMNNIMPNPCGKDNFGNAIMTHIFGVGTDIPQKHTRLKKCIIYAIEECKKNPNEDLKEKIYNNLTDNNWVEVVKRHVSKLAKSNYKIVIDPSWKQEQVYDDDDAFKKDAYLYIFSKADILA